MAQRHEIEAYLGGEWSPEQTDELVALIEATGSDDEAEWMRVIAEFDGDDLTSEILTAASRDYDRAGKVYDAARERFYGQVREAVAGGMTMYAAAKATGISQTMVAKIVRA